MKDKMVTKEEVVIFWFRRDLRLEDNIGLCQALKSGYKVLPVFIFDQDILLQFETRHDRRVDYIHQALLFLNQELKRFDSSVLVLHTTVVEAYTRLLTDFVVRGVYCNEDYEPNAIKRDSTVQGYLKNHNVPFYTFTDQAVFAKHSIMKKDGTPYQIYTPYAKMWKSLLTEALLNQCNYLYDYSAFMPQVFELPTLEALGYTKTDVVFTKPDLSCYDVSDYGAVRDFPALDATTKLGMALRFGTISIRHCVTYALKENPVWLAQLIWRDFFMQILYHYPHVATSCFKPKYEQIQWRNNENEFRLWCLGQTGYPIVDAGMRELNETGYMHNRVRMIVASFLSKHLLIDWRWGEAYFAQKLNDYDLAANNGNWQWAAGCGCDAAPYFRVFNPFEQQRKFDKAYSYTVKWVPEYQSEVYAPEIVEHKYARLRALEVYKKALK